MLCSILKCGAIDFARSSSSSVRARSPASRARTASAARAATSSVDGACARSASKPIARSIVSLYHPFTVVRPGAGARIGERFRIESALREGGMGHAFIAIDERTHQRVVVKTLRTGESSPGYVQRMFREARALSALVHPNVIRLVAFDVDAGL